MLCFFPSLRDLDHCRELISNTDGNVEVVHARKSFAGGKKTDWYGCIFPSVEHTDDINEVKRHFSAVSNETLREVHEKGEAWSKSFDSLSESPSGVVVENCSFLLDSVSWPPLQGAQNGVKDANWEICEVQTLSEILRNLELEHPESSDEWELLQRTPYSPSQDDPVYVPPTEESEAVTSVEVDAAPATGVTTRGTVRNYREALLKAPAKPLAGSAEADGGARKRVATASTWRPAIVVQEMKHEHKDRLYQHNLVEKGLDPNAYYYAEVDEDEGGYDGGSYFQSSEFAKGSVSVSRLRAATMLRPAALEKKMSRIAAREALKPPPPLGQLMTGKNGPSLVRTAIAARNSRFSSAAAAAGGDEDLAGYSD